MATQTLQDKLKALLAAAGAPAAYANQTNMPASMEGGPEQPPVQPTSQATVVQPPSDQPLPAPPPSMSPVLSAPGGGNTREMQAIQKQLREQLEKSRGQQQENIDNEKQALINQYAKKQDLDLSGGYATARMLGAEGAGAGYKAPEDVSKGDEPLRASLSKQQQALTDDQTNQLKAELQNKQLQQMMGNQRNSIMQDRMDRNEHMKILTSVKNDSVVKDYAGKMNSIERANVLLDKADKITTASLEEYQQTMRAALSNMKGGGGVGERAETYIKTADMQIAKIKQLMGDLDSIPKDHPLIQHLRDLAGHAAVTVGDQMEKRISAVTGGRKSLYARRPDLLGDLDDLKSLVKDSAIFDPKNELTHQPGYAPGAGAANAGGGYDGSASLPANATPDMKAARMKYLQSKAGQ